MTISIYELEKDLTDVSNNELGWLSGAGNPSSQWNLQPMVATNPIATTLGLTIAPPNSSFSVNASRTFNQSGGLNNYGGTIDLGKNVSASGSITSTGSVSAGVNYRDAGVSVGFGVSPAGISTSVGLNLFF